MAQPRAAFDHVSRSPRLGASKGLDLLGLNPQRQVISSARNDGSKKGRSNRGAGRSLWLIAAFALFLMLGRGTGTAVAQGYRVQMFQADRPGAFVLQCFSPYTAATQLNNKGQIITSLICLDEGYLVPPGALVGPFTDLTHGAGVPGGVIFDAGGLVPFITSSLGINNAGTVVGRFRDRNHNDATHGYLLRAPYPFLNAYAPLDFPGAAFTIPYGINDVEDVVGSYFRNGAKHGFLLSGGTFATIDVPGAFQTEAYGINNAGQIVGVYYTAPTSHTHGFLFSGGVFTTIDFPGQTDSAATAINNNGIVAGIGYPLVGDNGQYGGQGCFLWKDGVVTTIDFTPAVPAGSGIGCSGINDLGQLTGQVVDPSGSGNTLGFLATPGDVLVDPVPDLLNGPQIVGPDDQLNGQPGRDALATLGRPVAGVAADGVSQALIRIPAASEGDQFLLTIVNDNGDNSGSTDQDGALGNVGNTSFNGFGSGPLAITAVNTSSGPFAFAIYRAPVDFSRGSSFPNDSLPTTLSRRISIKVESLNGGTSLKQVAIIRPPVVFVHGIWGEQSTWKNFAGAFPGFQVGFANYTSRVGPLILISDPLYLNVPIPGVMLPTNPAFYARANSLGFQANAPRVLEQIRAQVNSLKLGLNPAGLPVAAIQADIVAHSMGGDITRTLPLQKDFLYDPSLGQGEVHKLISIDTPYLGSPFAFQMLKSSNACVRNIMAITGQLSFSSVTFFTLETASGAIGDLRGDGHDPGDVGMSDALNNIANPSVHPLPTALIVGTVDQSNLAGLDANPAPRFIKCVCGSVSGLCGNLFPSPLADKLTSTGWPTIFANEPNDAIVSQTSQLDGPNSGFPFPGVHSGALNKLGFGGPSVLDAGPIPAKVLDLLNTPVNDGTAFHKLPQ